MTFTDAMIELYPYRVILQPLGDIPDYSYFFARDDEHAIRMIGEFRRNKLEAFRDNKWQQSAS